MSLILVTYIVNNDITTITETETGFSPPIDTPPRTAYCILYLHSAKSLANKQHFNKDIFF